MHNAQNPVRQSDKRVEKTGEPCSVPEHERGTPLAAHLETVTVVAPVPESPQAESLPRTETILVVEDEDAVRRIACTILRRHGYTVIDAATPRRACEIFDELGKTID